MNSPTRALRRLAPPLSLLLLALPLPAGAVQAPAAASRAVAPNNAIIPLPLTPIVPAAQRVCTARTPTGLGYTVLRQATGAKPAATDVGLVNYIGYLAATGAVFDQGMQSPLPIDQVIPGFSQGMQMLARTGVIRLCIPAALGYGARESGPIPANSDLVFQVELLDFKTAAEVKAMRQGPPPAPAPAKGATPQ